MDQIYFYIALCVLILLDCVAETFGESETKTICAPYPGYKPFKNERCLKAVKFRMNPPTSYSMAAYDCDLDNGYLPTIDFEDKQRFVEEFLKRKKINGSVWLGLKNSNKRNLWADGTESHYQNWQAGYPKNDPAYCAQIKADVGDPNFGKWSYALCNETRHVIICERLPRWSHDQFQSHVLSIVKNPVPVDFIYIQLPRDRPPTQIWPWMGWSDISNEYNSTFFRVLGSESAKFGQVQPQNAPLLKFWVKDVSIDQKIILFGVETVPWNKWSREVGILYDTFADQARFRMRLSTEYHDLVPPNMAMRIWKRKY